MRKSTKAIIEEMTNYEHSDLIEKYKDLIIENNLLVLSLIGSLILNVVLIFN